MEQAILHCLMQRVDEWKWYRESACAAFILSRSDTAPLHLSRHDVERITKVVQRDSGINLGTDYKEFLYAPCLLVGLLR
ncbi:hypothetical protein [Paracoccus sp. (in: a-proteobacteria)]|uniref:hypothetical protein n=1 Tax=Paracoccus sp. TaxID=267 RepID=UPI00396CDCB6